jgi:hypothetical protein
MDLIIQSKKSCSKIHCCCCCCSKTIGKIFSKIAHHNKTKKTCQKARENRRLLDCNKFCIDHNMGNLGHRLFFSKILSSFLKVAFF